MMNLNSALSRGLLLLTMSMSIGPSLAFQVQTPFRAFSRSSSSVVSSRAAAVISVTENTGRDMQSMEEWAANCGVQRVESLQLTSEDGLDWSMATTQDLPEGSPILAVPNEMMLFSSRVQEELAGSADAAVDKLNKLGAGSDIQQFYLFLKVLNEYERGEESPYFPWLNSLPRLFYNAVSMTDFCYECLPPLVFSLARTERVKFDNFCTALKEVDVISEETKSEPSVLKWAFNVVYTRSWGPEGGEKLIVPMADMFNHGTETEIAIQYDENGNCNVYTTRDVPAGSPLRMSYGDPTNPSMLFATYGFLDETSPATFCKIMTMTQNAFGYDYSRLLFYKDTGDISEEVWDVALYEILASNRDVQQSFYNAVMNGDADTKAALHQQYFLETSSALKNHVDTFLKQLDELSAKGVGKDLDEHPRLPLIWRHNEFVKSTFLTVQGRLDAMVAQAAGEPAYT